MLEVLEVLRLRLLVPHVEDATDAVLGAHREPELGRNELHLVMIPSDATGPRSATLLGARVEVRHGR
jgi:hypothetical protein